MVLDDHLVKLIEIAETVSISKEHVYHVLHMLTLDQKHVQINFCKALVEQLEQSENDFCVDS